jgi:hypothetical protein
MCPPYSESKAKTEKPQNLVILRLFCFKTSSFEKCIPADLPCYCLQHIVLGDDMNLFLGIAYQHSLVVPV